MLSDETILSIKAPSENLCGPYTVVYKDERESWAIVALNWGDRENKTPSLGVRWFRSPPENQSEGGFPLGANRKAEWFIIPDSLHKTILAGLPLDVHTYTRVMRFLAREISGDELQESSST